MKKFALIATLTATSALLSPNLSAQDNVPTTQAAPERSDALKKAADDFSNLPEAQRKEFTKKRNDASVLFRNKRIFEALEITRELNDIFTDDPQVINLRGACFIEIRDFKRAMTEFQRARAIAGQSLSIDFNIGECSFVAKNWSEALKVFTETLKIAPANATAMKRLIEFKIMLSHIGLSTDKSLSEAKRKEHLDAARKLSKVYDYRDDSPYYYYATASMYFADGDEKNGQKYLNKGRNVFSGSSQTLSSWEDTLIEFGYVDSFITDIKK